MREKVTKTETSAEFHEFEFHVVFLCSCFVNVTNTCQALATNPLNKSKRHLTTTRNDTKHIYLGALLLSTFHACHFFFLFRRLTRRVISFASIRNEL